MSQAGNRCAGRSETGKIRETLHEKGEAGGK